MLAITSPSRVFFEPSPVLLFSQEKAQLTWRWCVRVLNKHTDLISSLGIFTLTTCLLVSKIFNNIPTILPRISLVVLNVGSIIWVNVQIRDFLKSCRDLKIGLTVADIEGVIITAAKCFVKGCDILLSCHLFSAAVIALAGFPHISATMYATMSPIAVASLLMKIGEDVYDYFTNESVLKKMETLSVKEAAITICFVKMMTDSSFRPKAIDDESRFTAKVIRQLDTPALEIFQETFEEKVLEEKKIFLALKDSLQSKQTGTKNSLGLISLGYVSMGICRMYPDSIIEYGVRWIMSLLYTSELIRQKIFQFYLAKNLSQGSAEQ